MKPTSVRSGGKLVGVRPGIAALVAGVGLGVGAPASAQQPVDVNAIKPTAPAGTPDALGPTAEDGARYQISRFILRYKSEHPDLPSFEQLREAPVRLGVSSVGYVAPREGGPSVVLKLGDVIEGTQGVFFRSAVDEVRRALVAELNARGVIGVFVQLDPEDVDEAADKDLRPATRSELGVVIWTGKIKSLRSIGTGERLGKNEPAINSKDLVHTRIRAQSPAQEGDVIRRDRIDDFLFRLNRHPGRRVDVALAPAGGPDNPEDVAVDYLITESKPWTLYAQLSNTGTRQTEEWRERFGFVHNQLTGHDDVLRVDYVTGGFKESNAITGSYEFPLLSDRIRMRLYGMWSEFDASNVGAAGEGFGGRTWQVGTEVAGLLWQQRESFLDVFGGVRWQNVSVTDQQLLPSPDATGEANFLIPYGGLRFDRTNEIMSTNASLSLEASLPDLASTSDDAANRLGRRQVDDGWVVVKFDAQHSMYLEPLFDRGAWLGGRGGGTFGATLAHEVVASLRGQAALGSRLIPNEQDVLGGLYSVRGYPESVSAGDSAVVVSLEYRFHYPRTFAASEPGRIGERAMPTSWPFGKDFRWAPQQPYGQADWDLVFKGFIDAGQTQVTDKLIGEFDNTLVGAGVGAELQFKRNFMARIDWGFALSSVDESGGTVDAGDNRVHFLFTLLY